MSSALAATRTDVMPTARFNGWAIGEPGRNGGETAPAALRRISSATKVETANARKIASVMRKLVSTVRIADASMHVNASTARNAKSRLVRAEYKRTSAAKSIR